MAKKKQQKVDIDLSSLASESGLVVLNDSDYATIKDRLPLFLPSVDIVLGGGLPFGRMVEVAGKPGGGKSTFAFHAARVATHLNCIVVLIDVEGTADKERLAHLGIDTSKVLVKQPDEDNGVRLTVEEIGRTVEQTMEVFKDKYPNTPVVYIWDSVGQTPSEVELNKDYGDQNVGARAKAITQFVTKVAPIISQTKSLLIGINQVRDDIGGNTMFPSYVVPGGKAWEHYASLRLEIQKKTAIKKGQDKIGHIMGVHVRKSKVSRPFQVAEAYLISDNGLDYEYNLAHMAKDAGILKNPGQSFEYMDVNGEIHKKKKELFIEWLKDDPAGNAVREEILNKLILHEYSEVPYTPLENETLEIKGWIDEVVPTEIVVTESNDNGNSTDIDSEIDNIIGGE